MSDVAKTPREELECKKKYLYEYSMFWECNDGSKSQILEEDVCEKLNMQQDTICKLQDLCGKSDGENAKLRIENKMLEKEVNLLRPTNIEQYEQIQKLQEENEQLRKELKEIKENPINYF